MAKVYNCCLHLSCLTSKIKEFKMADNANNRWMKLAEDVGKFAFSHLMDSVHVPLVKHQQSSKSVFIMLFKKREKMGPTRNNRLEAEARQQQPKKKNVLCCCS